MDTQLSKEQKMVQKSAKDFLKKEFPSDKIRELESSDLGYDQKKWKKIAELGWLGLTLPEEYDGMEMEFIDLVVLAEQVGYYLMPGPFFPTLVGEQLIIVNGTDDQKKSLLPKINDGKMILALADLEVSASTVPVGISTRAEETDQGFIINGKKLFVESAHIADNLLVLVKTGSGDDELSIFLVDTSFNGIERNFVPSIGLNRLFELDFKAVEVGKENLIGEKNKGWPLWEEMCRKGAILKCAEMVGGMKAVLEMTNQYVKERVAYGNPIGSYQVIQHKLADAWVKAHTSSYLTYQTAWKVSRGLPCKKEIFASKAWSGKSFLEVTRTCIHLHGAIGFTYEHDVGLYFRNAKACDLAFGDQRTYLQYIARELK